MAQAEPGVPIGFTLTLHLNATIAGMSVTDSLPSQMTYLGPVASNPSSLPAPAYNSGTNQLVWTLGALPAGTYQLAYQAQINNLIPAGTSLTNNAVLTYPGAPPLTASAQVAALGGYMVKISVYNSAGELVATLYTQQNMQAINALTLSSAGITDLAGASGAVTVYLAGIPVAVWNGNTASGDPATNGAYFVTAQSADPSGNVITVSQKVTVSRPYAQVSASVYNEAGEVVRHLYTQVLAVPGSQMTGVQVSSNFIRPGTTPSSPVSSAQILIQTSQGVVTLVWDGTDDAGAIVTNGTYEIGVHWDNGNGTIQNLSQSIVVTGSRSTGSVVAGPNLLNLSQGVSVTTFRADVPGAWTLNISVYTLAGERVKTTAGYPGADEVSWDASGMASGTYLAVVQVLDSHGGLLERRTVKVQVVH